jgi:hypothetical protein
MYVHPCITPTFTVNKIMNTRPGYQSQHNYWFTNNNIYSLQALKYLLAKLHPHTKDYSFSFTWRTNCSCDCGTISWMVMTTVIDGHWSWHRSHCKQDGSTHHGKLDYNLNICFLTHDSDELMLEFCVILEIN